MKNILVFSDKFLTGNEIEKLISRNVIVSPLSGHYMPDEIILNYANTNVYHFKNLNSTITISFDYIIDLTLKVGQPITPYPTGLRYNKIVDKYFSDSFGNYCGNEMFGLSRQPPIITTSTSQPLSPQLPTGNTSTHSAGSTPNPTYKVNMTGSETSEKPKEEPWCYHNWVKYEGFTETYEFCSKCDKKKDVKK